MAELWYSIIDSKHYSKMLPLHEVIRSKTSTLSKFPNTSSRVSSIAALNTYSDEASLKFNWACSLAATKQSLAVSFQSLAIRIWVSLIWRRQLRYLSRSVSVSVVISKLKSRSRSSRTVELTSSNSCWYTEGPSPDIWQRFMVSWHSFNLTASRRQRSPSILSNAACLIMYNSTSSRLPDAALIEEWNHR